MNSLRKWKPFMCLLVFTSCPVVYPNQHSLYYSVTKERESAWYISNQKDIPLSSIKISLLLFSFFSGEMHGKHSPSVRAGFALVANYSKNKFISVSRTTVNTAPCSSIYLSACPNDILRETLAAPPAITRRHLLSDML